MSAAARRIDEGLAASPVFDEEDGEVRLLGSRCLACGAVAFPSRAVCLDCGSEHAPERLSGRGQVHSWTLLTNPPAGFDEAVGYACIDLAEGPRILAALEGDRAEIGAQVQAVPGILRHGARGFRFEVRDA